MAGELQLWIRPPEEGDPVCVNVQPMATVGEVAAAAREALSLRTLPQLTFGGQELNDRAAQLADLGIGSQAMLCCTRGLTILLKRDSSESGEPDEMHLDADATLQDLKALLRDKYGPDSSPGAHRLAPEDQLAHRRRVCYDQFWIKNPNPPTEGEPVPAVTDFWDGVRRHQTHIRLQDDSSPIRSLGYSNGDVMVWFEAPMMKHRCKGRPYPPADRLATATTDHALAFIPQIDAEVEGNSDVAQLWLKQAEDEQASVASFAALTLRLMAAGAPAALLNACLSAGQDEVRHAEICYDFAAELGARGAREPRLLPPHQLEVTGDLTDLAARAVSEGAVGEAVAAASAAAAAAAATCERVAAAQRGIAADEARHAALAWATAAWAAREPGDAGAAVRAELAQAAKLLQAAQAAGRAGDPSPREVELLRHGHVEGALQDAIAARTQTELALPLLEGLAQSAALPDSLRFSGGHADPVARALSAVFAETNALLAACP
eukprot:TRINITY_DN3584_c0_g1_i1.p1 TRINITY_DN3584_c0_g1~~TRINITY_DN3584_c0_g1_i1.p1  ORF type:complete len:523 (+),score=115.98 TRINITY_DN3584_c0_g1_i1:95-1570(+)